MFWTILNIVDTFLFIIAVFCVAYIFFFSIASSRYQKIESGIVRKKGRFLILTTATTTDVGVEETIKSVLKQDYDTKNFDMLVVADNLTPLQNIKLAQFPIMLMKTNFSNGSKTQAQLHALSNMQSMKVYDLIILLDPDETVATDFLTDVNKVLQRGMKFFQLHRLPSRLPNRIATMSATIEEIDNSLFRKGHVALGLPSAVIGSALALDYNWFKEHADGIDELDEEKSLESLMLRQGIFVDYIDDINVFVRPTMSGKSILQKQQKSLKVKPQAILRNMKRLLPAILHWDVKMLDKIAQWVLMPQAFLLLIILLMSLFMPFIYFSLALKWWILLLVLTFSFALCIPDYLLEEK